MNEVKEQRRTNASRLSIAGSTFELILPLSSRANLAPEVAAAGVPSQLRLCGSLAAMITSILLAAER
jgi:hypothetical protein